MVDDTQCQTAQLQIVHNSTDLFCFIGTWLPSSFLVAQQNNEIEYYNTSCIAGSNGVLQMDRELHFVISALIASL